MARAIQAILSLRDNMSGGLVRVAHNTQGVTREMERATRQVVRWKDRAGRAIDSSVKKLGVLGGAAATAFGAFAIKTGMGFEAQMSKVAAISGASAEDVDRLSDAAKQMGRNTAFSATESAQALEYMAMAGWKTDQMISGLPGIVNLAAASGEDLALVSDIVTDGLTAFGMSAEDAGVFADVLAAASSNSNTNVAMLGETFKYVAPVAGALGYSIQDTATAIGLMANAGIKGSTAGTSLKNLLTNMANPTDKMNQAMRALGVNLSDEKGNAYSLIEIMQQLRKGFQGGALSAKEFNSKLSKIESSYASGSLSEKQYDAAMSELTTQMYGAEGAQKAQLAAMLAGKEGMAGFLAIVNASEEDFQKVTSAIQGSDGAAENMAETMNDNLLGKLKLLRTGIADIGNTFYEAISEKAQDSVIALTEWLKELQNNGAIDQIAHQVGEFFSTAIDKAASMLSWMRENSDLVFGAIKALGGLFVGLKIFKFAGDVAESANNLGLFAEACWRVSEPLRDNAVAAGKAAIEWGKNTISIGLNKGALVLHKIATVISTGVTAALTGAQAALNAAFVATPIGWIVLGIAAIIAAGVLLYKNWDKVKEAAVKLWQKVKNVFGNIKDSIVGAFDYVKEKVAGFFSWLDEKISSIPIIGNLYGGAKKIMGGAASWIADQIGSNASGTSYWRGGLTTVHERGGELMNLPSGTQIIPHDISMRAAESYGSAAARLRNMPIPAMAAPAPAPTINLSINVNGNLMGNEQAANEFGEIIVGKILGALNNL